jgi:hypothetical protein
MEVGVHIGPLKKMLTEVALIRVEPRRKSVYISCCVCTTSGPSNGRKADKDRRLLLRSTEKRGCRDVRPICVAGECSVCTYASISKLLCLSCFRSSILYIFNNADKGRRALPAPLAWTTRSGTYHILAPRSYMRIAWMTSTTHSLMIEVLNLLPKDEIL